MSSNDIFGGGSYFDIKYKSNGWRDTNWKDDDIINYAKDQMLRISGIPRERFNDISFGGSSYYSIKYNMKDYIEPANSENVENLQSPIVNDPSKAIILSPDNNIKRPADELKAKQKELIKTKFIVGQLYALRTKSKDGSKSFEKIFECKKFIYTINEVPVNIVIMKQLSGDIDKIFTLNKHDCKLYHIKYEDGLQVWPMQMKWVKIKQKENK